MRWGGLAPKGFRKVMQNQGNSMISFCFNVEWENASEIWEKGETIPMVAWRVQQTVLA